MKSSGAVLYVSIKHKVTFALIIAATAPHLFFLAVGRKGKNTYTELDSGNTIILSTKLIIHSVYANRGKENC